MSRGPEAERQQRITDALDMFNWRWVWYRPAQTTRGWRTPLSGHRGAPDIWAAHEERALLLIIEAKRDGGKLEPEQLTWAAALLRVMMAARANVIYIVADSPKSEAHVLDIISDGRIPTGGAA